MKKGDVVIIVIMSLLVISGSAYVYFKGAGDLNKILLITQDQEVIHKIKMNNQYEKIIEVKNGDDYNYVHIKNGEVWIESANCDNQVCVYVKPISKVGEVIVCLPHKLIIEIKGNGSSEVDIISE